MYPDGERRRLLVLFAYAKLRAMLVDSDQALAHRLAPPVEGIEIGGSVDVPREEIEAWCAELPDGAPNDLQLVGARPLLDLVEELIRSSCERMPDLYDVVADVRTEPLCCDYVTLGSGDHSVDEWLLLAAVNANADVIGTDGLAFLGGIYARADGARVAVLDFDACVNRYVNLGAAVRSQSA